VVDTNESTRDCGRALEDVPSFRKDRSLSYCWMGRLLSRAPVRPFLPPVSRPTFRFSTSSRGKDIVRSATRQRQPRRKEGSPRFQWEFFISVCSLPKCWLATTKPMKLFSELFSPSVRRSRRGIWRILILKKDLERILILILISKALGGSKDPWNR